MDLLFADFQNAQANESGPFLAATLSPVPPPFNLHRLEAIYNTIPKATAEQTIGYNLTRSFTRTLKYPSPEVTVWTDIYVAYYRALGDILAAKDADQKGLSTDHWVKVYSSWKILANNVIKGYNDGVLQAWTLPVMYLVGKFLRQFAVKADESAKKSDSGIAMDAMATLQDDIAGEEYGKNDQLEEAARTINRMFISCHSDRYAGCFRLGTGLWTDGALQCTDRRVPEMG